MRSVDRLVHSRTRTGPRHALMPLEGFPVSKLPSWPGCEARVLASPALGANFVQTLFDIPVGGGRPTGPARRETFGYVLSGRVRVEIVGDEASELTAGGFFFVPEEYAPWQWLLNAEENARVLLLEKKYEPHHLPNIPSPEPLIGHTSEIPAEPWGGTDHARLQTLVPDTLAYDMAMNIFTFDPGFGLPIVETHVMEHGAMILAGKGLYYLEDSWVEVERDDFLWMGPFCPQSFYATGPTPASYIYYKNVNREIPL